MNGLVQLIMVEIPFGINGLKTRLFLSLKLSSGNVIQV